MTIEMQSTFFVLLQVGKLSDKFIDHRFVAIEVDLNQLFFRANQTDVVTMVCPRRVPARHVGFSVESPNATQVFSGVVFLDPKAFAFLKRLEIVSLGFLFRNWRRIILRGV